MIRISLVGSGAIADNDVIEDLDVEELAGLVEPLGYCSILGFFAYRLSCPA
jgi:hypothetical protein